MALLFMDSFDHYATADLLEKWSNRSGITIVAGAGRRGSACLRTASTSDWAGKVFSTSSATMTVGAAVNFSSASISCIFLAIAEATVNHVVIQWNTTGAFHVYRSTAAYGHPQGGTLTALGNTTGGLLGPGTYGYLECKATIHDTTGSVELRLNGVSVLSLVNIDTRNGGTGVASAVTVGQHAAANALSLDDLYVCDGSGPAPWNSFLGDCRVDALLPAGAGASTGWTPSAGTNYQAVDEAAPNDDTDYVTAITTPLTDTYTYPDAPLPGATLYGVQHCLAMKKMDSGVCTIAPVIRSGGVDYPGAGLSPGTSYAYGLQVAATNPATSAQWTEAGFNAAEFGYRRTG